MAFKIKMGKKQMKRFWDDLETEVLSGEANSDEISLYNKLHETFELLKENPFHNSLRSKYLKNSKEVYGKKVYESSVENNTPSALRVFWKYGKEKGTIVILNFGKHPNKSKEYKNLKFPDIDEKRLIQDLFSPIMEII